MCDPVSAITTVATAVIGAVNQRKQAKKADKRSKEANAIAKENSEKQLAQQEREFNTRNRKSPNVAALFANNQASQKSQTLLSGTGGVDPANLNLGRNTLLGQ